MSNVNPSPIKPRETQSYQPVQEEDTSIKALPTTKKSSTDTISTTKEEEQTAISSTISTPVLTDPQRKSISISEYTLSVLDTLDRLKQQFRASQEIDYLVQQRASLEIASQAKEIGDLIDEQMKARLEIDQKVSRNHSNMQDRINRMDQQTRDQQKAIDNLNKGNALEQQKNQELADAYEKYIQDLEAIGAVDKGNGNYEIPPESTDQYNAITKEYQKSVDDYNAYWSARQKEIEKYNSGTVDYNQGVKDNNKACDDFTQEYDLSDDLDAPIGTQPEAALRDTSGYPKEINKPATIDQTPAVVQTYPPPAQVYTTAQLGVRPIGSISYTPIDSDTLKEAMLNSQYDEYLSPYDQAIYSNVKFWSFTQKQTKTDEAQEVDPATLSTRKLVKMLIRQQLKDIEETNESPLKAVSIEHSSTEKILGKSIIQQVLVKAGIKLTEAKQQELANQILILSVGLLSHSSLNSLFPSLSLIANALPSLPQENPILPLLFSVSFMNRIIETSEQGLTKATLMAFIEERSELSELSEHQVDQLVAAMNIGQLLTAGKMLETQLRLPGLMPQLLFPLFEEKVHSNIVELFQDAMKENQHNLATMHKELMVQYTEQGHPAEAATFLADMSVKIISEEQSQRTTTLPSPKNLNLPLLVDSLKANLLFLKGPTLSLSEADSIARKSVEHTLSEGPFKTTNQFHNALEKQLIDIGIKGQAIAVSRSVILASTTPKTAVSLPTTVKDTTISSLNEKESTKELPILPMEQYRLKLSSYVEQLTIPFLGASKAKEISEEVIHTILGDQTEPVATKKQLNFIKTIEHQIAILKEKQEEEYNKVIEEDFKETIKTSISFYAFSLKLMDPLAAYTMIGLMYSNPKSGGNLNI